MRKITKNPKFHGRSKLKQVTKIIQKTVIYGEISVDGGGEYISYLRASTEEYIM